MIINEAKATGVKQNPYLQTAIKKVRVMTRLDANNHLPLDTNPMNIHTVISHIGWKLK